MKTLTRLVILLVLTLPWTGCNGPSEPEPPPPPHSSARPSPTPEVLPSAAVEMENASSLKRELRLHAESQLAEQETAKTRWQNGALLSVSGALVLLIVGIIRGSRARRDAKS